MSPRRAALLLLLVGAVLLPGPAYTVGLERLDGPERYRSSAGYEAAPIDASNDRLLVDRYGSRVSFWVEGLAYRHVAHDYRVPNRTRRVLDRALRTGTATTDDGAVGADLRRLARNYSFLTGPDGERYSYAVPSSGGTTAVETERTNDSAVAAAVREESVVDYDDLPPAERRTFDRIRNATRSEEEFGYRPWSGEPVPEAPIVARNGTHYAVGVVVHVDDFDLPDGLLLGVAGSGVGVFCLFASGVVYLASRRRA